MADEYWATFSIYDHQRAALYRQALLLFDRVVMPIPTRPIGKLKRQDLDQLDGDVQLLEEHGAAVRFNWDPDEFYEWQRETAEKLGIESESLASKLSADPPLLTRLQLKEKYSNLVPSLRPSGVDSVTAMPVYGSTQRYEYISENLRADAEERLMLEVVSKRVPMPAPDVPLEDILRVRESKSFRESARHLRDWQWTILPQLLMGEKERAIRKAGQDFDRWITQYNQVIEEARINKIVTSVLALLTMGAMLSTGAGPVIQILADIAPAVFSVKELRKPSWKIAAEKECAPAGIVYEATRLRPVKARE